MFFKLFLLFTLVPALELGLLVYIGSSIGTLNTITIVVITAVIGAYMVRSEGIGVIYRIQRDLGQGAFPADELLNGAMILVAGVLLLTPGFVTDVLGFALVLPASRAAIKPALMRFIKSRIEAGSINVHRGP